MWALHCIYRRHISKGDSFLPDVYYVKVKTCGGYVILIDMGYKKVAFVFVKITLAGLCCLFSPTMAGFAECPVTLRTSYMACHRYAVIAVVEAGGDDIKRNNEALKEGGCGYVSSVGKVTPRRCVYCDAERHVFLAAQV